MNMLQNVSQCVCPAGKSSSARKDLRTSLHVQDLLVITVNMRLMNVNQIHVQCKANVLIYQMDIPVFVVRRELKD